MKTLELAHVAAYYPYGVKIQHPTTKSHFWTLGHKEQYDYINIAAVMYMQDYGPSAKLVLHPLSDLTKKNDFKGEKFIPVERVEEIFGYEISLTSKGKVVEPINMLPYCVVRQLIEWHFDIFSLIPAGLAVDINTVKV